MTTTINFGGSSQPAMVDVALAYARRGWRVFPVKRNKQPLTLHGCKDATTDEATIRAWFERYPHANVAIATGRESDLVVVDIDPDHGGIASWLELDEQLGFPKTRIAKTGGGGLHLYLRHPGTTVRNSAGKLGPGLDVRGDGGYVVAPPSIHESGTRYEWADPDREISEMPDWLQELCCTSEQPVKVEAPSYGEGLDSPGSPYGLSALTAEAEALRNAPEGTRNDQLNRAAFSIGQLVGGHELDLDHATEVLEESALDCGLDPTEIDGTLARALADGAQHPRTTKDTQVVHVERVWPELLPAAFHGIAGEIVRAIEPHSESDPAALLLTVLATAGAIIGRAPHILVDSAEHPARLFVVLAGETAKARKGTSWNNIERVFRIADPDFIAERVMNGFGSGESIIDAVADNADSQHLLIHEPEFA